MFLYRSPRNAIQRLAQVEMMNVEMIAVRQCFSILLALCSEHSAALMKVETALNTTLERSSNSRLPLVWRSPVN